MTTPTGEPILIECEGTGCPPCTRDGVLLGTCAMCGAWVLLGKKDEILPHQRDDVIARIKRGDFG